MSGVAAGGRLWPPVLIALGVVMLLAAGFAAGYPVWWNHRSSTAGRALVTNFVASPGGLLGEPAPQCVNPPRSATSDTAAGLIEIPTLGMTAPVLQGLSAGVLDVAAGHDAASPWPGGPGESVVESHDVSYFSEVDKLKRGAAVLWIDHCAELRFDVIGHEILKPGAPLRPPASGRGLALITCYPTDALFYTPDRFVLLTTLRATSVAPSRAVRPPEVVLALRVPAPPRLVEEGLDLASSDVLVGFLRITGTPSARFRQSPAGLDLESLALESYIGAEKAVAQHESSWWRDLAVGGVSMPAAPWSDGLDTNVIERVHGTTVQSVTLSSANETFVLKVVHRELLIASVRIAA